MCAERGSQIARVTPWFWTWDGTTQDFTGGPKFDGNRQNDLHYTRKAKEAARAKAPSGKPVGARP